MKYPPSLSRVEGISDVKLREDRTIRQLAAAIERLAPDPEPILGANMIYDCFCLANLVATQKRKDGSSSPTKVAKQLRQIASGSATLARRLKAADKDVFDAWAGASEDADSMCREIATQEWLHLKTLLDEAERRATRAAKTAERVLRLWQRASKKGRPTDWVADFMTEETAALYTQTTGKNATRLVNRDTGAVEGEFHVFLTDVFDSLGMKSSPDAANMRLQERLKKLAGQ